MSATDRPSAPTGEVRVPLLALIDALEQKALGGGAPEAMGHEVLRAFIAVCDGFYGAWWRAAPAEQTLAIAFESAPKVSEAAARAWGPALNTLARATLQQGKVGFQPVAEPADRLATGQGCIAVGVPIRNAAGVEAAATLVVRQGHPVLTDAGLAVLRLLAGLPMVHAAASGSAQAQASYQSLSAAWALIGEMLAFTCPTDQAQVVVNRARSIFHADRVTIGFVDRNRVTVAAISGEDTIDRRSNVVQALRGAQMEVVLAGEPGEFSDAARGEARLAQTSRNPQHEHLARLSRAHTVISLPLRHEKEWVGVWTFEFGETPFRESDRAVMEVSAGQIGPVLHLAMRSHRGPWRRIRDAADAAVRWVFHTEHPWRRAAAVAGLAFVVFAVACPWRFNVTGNCVLMPAFRRVYGAPFDTTIAAAPVRPGDTVERGQVIVEFDRDEVEVQLREARSKRTSAEKEMLSYLAEQKVSQYAEAKARFDGLAAQVELLERHLARTSTRADFAGVIVSGDLKQDTGRTVRMGQELIELAPLNELILQVEVEQGDVAYVKEGMRGDFTTKARPGATIPFTVDRLHPMPEVRKGESVFIVEATVANAEGWLRPGMEGAARIRIGSRNVTWVATRKVVNWLRLHVWW